MYLTVYLELYFKSCTSPVLLKTKPKYDRKMWTSQANQSKFCSPVRCAVFRTQGGAEAGFRMARTLKAPQD